MDKASLPLSLLLRLEWCRGEEEVEGVQVGRDGDQHHERRAHDQIACDGPAWDDLGVVELGK